MLPLLIAPPLRALAVSIVGWNRSLFRDRCVGSRWAALLQVPKNAFRLVLEVRLVLQDLILTREGWAF